MSSCIVKYDDIFARCRSRIGDQKFWNLPDVYRREFLVDWLHSARSISKLRNAFDSIKLDDEDGSLTFELNNSHDNDDDDIEFAKTILSIAISIEWLRPRVDNDVNTSVMIGGKEEKKLLDNYSQNRDRLASLRSELEKEIRDRSTYDNTYINES